MDISELKYISSELTVTVAATLALLSGVFSGKYILAKVISLVGIFTAFVFAIGLWFEPSTYAFYNTQ